MTPTWTILAAVFAMFAFGAVMIALFGTRARRPGAAGELWRYYASTALIVAGVLLPAAVHPLLFTVMATLLAWRCMVELGRTYAIRPHGLARMSFPLLALVAVWVGGGGYFIPLVGVALALSIPVYAMRHAPAGAAAWPAVILFPLLAATSLTHLIARPDGFVWIFLLYATVETQDSMAFLFGRLFGRRPVLPRLSPRKTTEGVIAGALFGGALAAALAQGLLHRSPSQALTLAALLVAAGLAGDLFTSRLKRVAGIKDFPAVSVLHGGLLDIYDSTLFAAIPLALLPV